MWVEISHSAILRIQRFSNFQMLGSDRTMKRNMHKNLEFRSRCYQNFLIWAQPSASMIHNPLH